jgi:hypothetical protein
LSDSGTQRRGALTRPHDSGPGKDGANTMSLSFGIMIEAQEGLIQRTQLCAETADNLG